MAHNESIDGPSYFAQDVRMATSTLSRSPSQQELRTALAGDKTLRLTYVTDVLDDAKSGAVITAQRFLAALRAHIKIRILTTDVGGPNITVLPSIQLPVGNGIMKANGMRFGRPIRALMEPVIAASDVVYVHLPFWLSQEAIAIAQRLGKPIVAGYHILPNHLVNFWRQPPKWLLALLHQWMIHNIYRHADAVVAPSNFARQQLLQGGLERFGIPVHVISNGIPSQFAALPTPEPIGQAPGQQDTLMKVVCVGRFSTEKNQATVIRAIAAARHGRQMQLYLVGAGPLEASYRKLAQQLQQPAHIGYIANDALTGLLQQADVVVHAATLETEGMSLLEAMGCGAPVLIADSPLSAAPELIAHEAKYLFAAEQVQALADKLDAWFESPSLRATAKQFVIERAKNYAFANSVTAFTNLLQQVAHCSTNNGAKLSIDKTIVFS